MSKLMIMIGLPRSGKSTLAKEMQSKAKQLHGDNYTILSADTIRMELNGVKTPQKNEREVWNLFYKRYEQYLAEGRDIIIDNTNVGGFYREGLLSHVNKTPHTYTIIAVVMDTPLEVIYERASKENFPTRVINNMLRNYTSPRVSEGFDVIFQGNGGSNV